MTDSAPARLASESDELRHRQALAYSAIAAFCVYFCMYAFRKPIVSATTYQGAEVWGWELKSVLVISQLLGYLSSKFIGIKVISEMPSRMRSLAILGLIGLAQLSLIAFAWAPLEWKVVLAFANGLPLGMVFGLVLAYLEGRTSTEALSAVLCASFILASGVVVSVGQRLMQDYGVSEFAMPMVTGSIFVPPLLVSVWWLSRTPAPRLEDLQQRAARTTMSAGQRREFVRRLWPILSLLLAVYVALTVIRTVRSDFSVEIWRDMGIDNQPAVFTVSETWVAVCVTAANALIILVRHHLSAMRVTFLLMIIAFLLIPLSTWLQARGDISPLVYMVLCGIGMYIPYVAFHTTVFERLIATVRQPGNLGFVMYLADSLGYLGVAVVLGIRSASDPPAEFLPFFRGMLVLIPAVSVLLLGAAMMVLQRLVSREQGPEAAAREETVLVKELKA